MDIIFKCANCDQELEVDASGAGSQINCPSCNAPITVPNPEPANIVTMPEPTNAARTAEKHYTVPHDKVAETLIQRPNRSLDAAKDADKKLRVKTIRRSDCMEGNTDKFDQRVSDFLEQIGQPNIISINAINTAQDYGVLIVFKG